MRNSYLNTIMNTYNKINTEDNGISFTKEGFDQCFHEYSKELEKSSRTEAIGFCKGWVAGLSVGAVTMGIVAGHVHHKLQKKASERRVLICLGDLLNEIKNEDDNVDNDNKVE